MKTRTFLSIKQEHRIYKQAKKWYNGVVDFLEFGFMEFPIFNIADSFLTVGVAMLAVHVLFFSKDGTLPFMEKKENKEKEENIEVVEEK